MNKSDIEDRLYELKTIFYQTVFKPRDSPFTGEDLKNLYKEWVELRDQLERIGD